MIVLDASALLAVLFQEPGSDQIEPRLATAVIGAANFAEVLAKVAERGNDPDFVAGELRVQGIQVEPVTEAHAVEAARLRLPTRHLGLSLGDRLCLALARTSGLPVITTDRIWAQYDFGIPVEVAR